MHKSTRRQNRNICIWIYREYYHTKKKSCGKISQWTARLVFMLMWYVKTTLYSFRFFSKKSKQMVDPTLNDNRQISWLPNPISKSTLSKSTSIRYIVYHVTTREKKQYTFSLPQHKGSHARAWQKMNSLVGKKKTARVEKLRFLLHQKKCIFPREKENGNHSHKNIKIWNHPQPKTNKKIRSRLNPKNIWSCKKKSAFIFEKKTSSHAGKKCNHCLY